MQKRLELAIAFEEYVTSEGWKTATLSCCPTCEGGVVSAGTYRRKEPKPAKIARFYCEACRHTISLLPDFYASHIPGLLAEIEDAVAMAEGAPSVKAAAEQARAADTLSPEGAVKWLRRRVRIVHEILATVIGLLPDTLSGCGPSLEAIRTRLGHSPVLVKLREMCAEQLSKLPSPLGFRRRVFRATSNGRHRQQSTGPDPPRALA